MNSKQLGNFRLRRTATSGNMLKS